MSLFVPGDLADYVSESGLAHRMKKVSGSWAADGWGLIAVGTPCFLVERAGWHGFWFVMVGDKTYMVHERFLRPV